MWKYSEESVILAKLDSELTTSGEHYKQYEIDRNMIYTSGEVIFCVASKTSRLKFVQFVHHISICLCKVSIHKVSHDSTMTHQAEVLVGHFLLLRLTLVP